MKARKRHQICTTVRTFSRELLEERRVHRAIVNRQKREIAELRKHIAELKAGKERELDNIINRLHASAKQMKEMAERELLTFKDNIWNGQRLTAC